MLSACDCRGLNESTQFKQSHQQESFYNLEAIELGTYNLQSPSFFFNGQALVQEGPLYTSPDLLVYCTKSGNWRATFIGKGYIRGTLEIKVDNKLVKQVPLSNNSNLVRYADQLGTEWPGIYNVGNSCFANAIYKLMARCEGFDVVINQDKTGSLPTSLRNMINGIRLGKRSSLQEESVNRWLNKRLLELISSHPNLPPGLNKNFNDQSGNDSRLFLTAIYTLLYKEDSLRKIKIQPPQMNLYLEQGKNLPFQIIRKNKLTNNLVQEIPITVCKANILFSSDLTHWEATGFINGWQSFLYQAPAFMVVDMTTGILPPATDGHYLRLQESQKVRIYHYQDDSYISDKEYQLIGFTCGVHRHATAYIYFPNYGWYCHNDAVVSQEQFDKISAIHWPNATATHNLQVLALYKLKS